MNYKLWMKSKWWLKNYSLNENLFIMDEIHYDDVGDTG
jgi:hypothetical protein